MFYIRGQDGVVVNRVTHYGLDGPGIEPQRGQGIVSSHLFKPAMHPTQPPLQQILGLFARDIVCEAWHWPSIPQVAQ